MNLLQAVEGKEYIVSAVQTEDEELDSFLFSLGCFSGEPITVVSRRRGGCTVAIRDGRYNIDNRAYYHNYFRSSFCRTNTKL